MDDAVLDAISRFTSAGTWQDRRQVFHDLAETLCSPDALGLLAYNVTDERHPPHVRRALSARLRLLERSRDEIEAVFADSGRLHDVVLRFLNAGTHAERCEIAEEECDLHSGVGVDQVFADLLLQDRETGELEYIGACWDTLEALRVGVLGAADPVTLDEAVAAFLSAGRWSETQRLLELPTDELFSEEAIGAIEQRAESCDDPERRAWIDERLGILRAAQRLGLPGAYAYAQGFGRGGMFLPGELVDELQAALHDTELLEDLVDRHPTVLPLYQKAAGWEPVGPMPPSRVPEAVTAAAEAIMQLAPQSPPDDVVARLAPFRDRLDPRLYPGLYGAIHLRVADARARMDGTEAGLQRALPDFDAARTVFTAERFPIDHGETAYYLGRAQLARGHAVQAIHELECALEYLDVRAREDTLLMATAPRSADEIESLHDYAELTHAEALWRSGRAAEAQERAREIEEAHAEPKPERAAEACLLQALIAPSQEFLDPDDRTQVIEGACRRGLALLSDVAPDSETSLRLQAQRIHVLLRPEAYGMKERVAEASALLQEALASADPDSRAAAELKLVEHELLSEYHPQRDWRSRARECAREILRLAKHLKEPRLEAEANVRMGDVAAPRDVLKYYRRAAEQLGELSEHEDQAEILRRIGNRCFEKQDWEGALEAYDEARAIAPPLAGLAEDAFRRSAKSATLYPEAAYAALKLGRYTDAFRISEAGKTRFLEELIAGRSGALAELPFLLQSAGGAELVVTPVVTSQGTATFIIPCDARSVLAEYVVYTDVDERAWSDLLTTWMGEYFRFTAEQDIEAWESAVDDACGRCWELLMEAVLERVIALGAQPGSPLLFVPPNLLAPLPFHAARDAQGRYPFAEDYPLAHAPGLELLPLRAGAAKAESSAKTLAFINPDGDLPFSPYELRALMQHVPSEDLQAFEGKNARCERFFEHAEGMDYLHFACHAFHHWAKPLETGVKLADGGLGAFSFLTSEVDMGQTRLACLSACETGITTAFRRLYGNTLTLGAEEYMGLPAAMHAAGVECVLSTLWPVEDYVATLLIEEFYRLHLAKGQDCLDALRGAREGLRRHTAAHTLRDVRQRLSDPTLSEELTGYLRGIEELVERDYAPDDRPFDHPMCWAPYVLSGAPLSSAKSS